MQRLGSILGARSRSFISPNYLRVDLSRRFIMSQRLPECAWAGSSGRHTLKGHLRGSSTPCPPPPSGGTVSLRMYETAHGGWKMRIQKFIGDGKERPDRIPKLAFFAVGVLQVVVSIPLLTSSNPVLFETCLPWHLKFSSLVVVYLSAVHWGLDIGRYGCMGGSSISGVIRCCSSLCGFFGGFAALLLGDFNPLFAYRTLLCVVPVLGGLEVLFHWFAMSPLWYFRWSVAFLSVHAASVAGALVKTQWLNDNARRLVLEADIMQSESDFFSMIRRLFL
uniref:Uncharacterized protein n=1 Tax=Chromera velia CCMP2878 TaxID=1169474 RepID=A0A0G4EZI5_9ALVE|eukprot:Cvel_14420.t1-p1 / transcript=Cvel_14420.t1 / gene=Cvel_14420 / organism=Chromera_velia_CCMP2878 / gene_product=hypothetical protein / transcript_product=hypothetical protein / location=Cvel_scaffold1025:34088-36570(-) / protein_length=277 / sequence_SO=supercontig / SO=protein_coding / is_pseudo=false